MYIIQEIQTEENGTVTILPPIMREDAMQAESEFHLKLCYAAVSNLSAHAVIIFDETGALKKRECYYHNSVPVDDPDSGPID